MRCFLAFSLVLLALAPPVSAAPKDPELTIQSGVDKRVYTRSQLLKRKDLQKLTISNDPAYPGKTMTYTAVPAAVLFEGVPIPADGVIQFRALDGFSAPISKERLLNTDPNKSRAFVAIEPELKPWPAIKKGGPTTGPFYLIWPDPKLSQIGPEEWPFQLAAFEVKGSVAEVYPKILPAADLPADHPARKGFESFQKNCFACHTMNKSGAAQVGPDLNLPMNPTEYFTPEALRKLIRDPQSVRHFPTSRMSPFPPDVLPDAELDAVVAYLQHMATRKQP